MSFKWSSGYWRLVVSILVIYAMYALFSDRSIAQITPDLTLGTENSIQTPNVSIDRLSSDRIDGGARRGTSLFHSFREFNIGNGQRVFFANPIGVENIFSRVTGTNPSQIFGTLGVNGGANLFLLNPNGIIFGNNARLDLRGSFFASTASGIKFENGTEFSTNNPSAPPLLTLNIPIGLQYRRNAGRILVQGQGNELRIDQNTGEVLSINRAGGLQVNPGQTLVLAGSEVVLEGASLSAESGRIELWSVQGESLLGLTATNPGWELSDRGVDKFQDIRLSQTAVIDTNGIGGGKIKIQGQRVTLQDGSSIVSLTRGERNGETISIKASESLEANGNAINGEASLIVTDTTGVGKAGDVEINTRNLILQNGAQVSSSTYSQGSGGKIRINASELVEATGITKTGNFASGLFSVTNQSNGEGGIVEVTTKQLVLRDGAQVSAATFGQGLGGNVLVNAAESVEAIGIAPIGFSGLFAASINTGDGGKVEINTGNLILREGAQISAITFSQGNGGNVLLNASESVQILGVDQNGRFPSALVVQTRGVGKGGTLEINTKKLTLEDGALVSATAFSQGNAGNVIVNASKSVEILGSSQNGRFTSSLRARTRGTGNAGKIEINTGKLILQDGALVSSTTTNAGKGGDVLVSALESVEVRGFGSGLRAQTQGTGDGGTVTINTKKFLASKGAQTLAAAFADGKGGNINIQASEVKLTGTSGNGEPTIIYASTLGKGDGGEVRIDTSQLTVRDGAQIGAGTFSSGRGGNVFIKASDGIELVGTVPQVPNRPFFRDQSGEQFPSGLFTGSEDTGTAGNLRIETRKLTVEDGAGLSVNNQGIGNAGNLEVAAGNIFLSNQAFLSATTTSGKGGNIILNVDDLLLLRRNSQISTTAGIDLAGGDGGNILINSGLIVAIPKENSDITANAFTGKGGNINITTQGLLGLEFRNSQTDFSDITASSEFGIAGVVNIDILGIDPAKGLTELPTEIVDGSKLIAQNFCRVVSQESQFVVTGRGGLPNSPNQTLTANTPWEDLRLVEENKPPLPKLPPTSRSEQPKKKDKQSERIVEAQGWITTPNGDVLLTAKPVIATSEGLWLHPQDCRLWKQTIADR